jgi:hypothetical protein
MTVSDNASGEYVRGGSRRECKPRLPGRRIDLTYYVDLQILNQGGCS